MGEVAIFEGEHVLECDQVDFVAELVFSWDDFVRLVDVFGDDVVGAAGLKDLLDLSGHLQRNVGYLLLGS